MKTRSLEYLGPVIHIQNVTKRFQIGSRDIPVINGIDLEIFRGEFVVLMGPSGSGKTTLINLLGGIDRVSSGAIVYNIISKPDAGKTNPIDITKLSDSKLASFRRKNLSYVFQFYSLIPTLTAKENVQLMAELIGLKGKELHKNSEHWLSIVGLQDRMDSFPGQLSGGENQRVAIARAIAKKPQILLCDEPTGQLDQKSGRQVVETLYSVCKTTETTIIMVTHDIAYKDFGDKVIFLEDGLIRDTELHFQHESYL